MWNPLVLQPHHRKNHKCTLLALKTYPWVATHCKASVTSTEECDSPGMDQNQTLLSAWPWMQGAYVWRNATLEIQTQFTSFLWCLVLGGSWSTTLCSQGSPVFHWGQHGELKIDKGLFDSLLNHEPLSNRWLSSWWEAAWHCFKPHVAHEQGAI